MKKVLAVISLLIVFTLCLAPIPAMAADTSQGYFTDGEFDFTKLYEPVKAADLSSWTNIFWNALVWITFGSPLASTFIGRALSVVVLGGNGIGSIVTLISSLGIFGAFIAITILLNHFRGVSE